MMSPLQNESEAPGVAFGDGSGIRVKGTALLVDIAADVLVRGSYPLLAAAVEQDLGAANGPATLAACLAPATACSRLADSVFCVLNASAICIAREPGSELHSIIGGGPCWRANRSATSAAFVALAAELELSTALGSKWVPAEDFLALGEIAVDAVIVSAKFPTSAASGYQRLTRAPQLDDGSSTIFLAAVRRADGDVRLVLGGVAPAPYRIYNSVEEEAMTGGLDEDTIAGLADRALLDAEADPRTARSVDLAAALLRDAITEIAST